MRDTPSRLTAFLAELKRRRVFRVAVVYAGVAFIVIQIIDGAFDYLKIPEWIGSLIIIMLAVGFLIAVGMAWAFDLTAEGLVRTRERKRDLPKKPPRPVIGNKTLAVIALLAVIAAAWSWWGRPSSAGPITSIAVLPLENLMGDPDQDYFVDGMHDALITELSRINALTVISRNSAMYYKDKDIRTPEIARQLNVDAVVEGSVFKAEGQVRITAQLIDGRTDKHLWANDYSRALTDIIALQKSIASAIAQEIKATLTPEEEARLASAQPVNPEAHEAYLKGRYHLSKRTEEGFHKAREQFEQAIAAAPGFALAHAGLADTYELLGEYGMLPAEEAYPRAKAAARRALGLDDALAEAHAVLAAARLYSDFDWSGAEQGYQKAIALNPGYATAHQWYAELLNMLGRHDEAIAEITQAQKLDPLSLIINTIMGDAFYYARQYNQAIEQLRKTIDLDPNFLRAHTFLPWVLAQVGRDAEALAEELWLMGNYEGATAEEIAAGRSAYDQGGIEGFYRWRIEQLKTQPSSISLWLLPLYYAILGEKDEAFARLEVLYETHNSMIFLLKVDPAFDSIRDDPRFQDLLRRMNFPE